MEDFINTVFKIFQNQEQKLRLEMQNRVELQSQAYATLEEQRDVLQRKCSHQEDQLRQYVYVEPCIYFDSYHSETRAVTYIWSHHVVTKEVSTVCLQETHTQQSESFVQYSGMITSWRSVMTYLIN
jgi:hypothetical protein